MADIKTNKDFYKPTDFFVPSQPNPTERLGHGKKGDCVIRAYAHVFDVSWLEAFDILCERARRTYDVPNDDLNLIGYCEEHGHERQTYKAIKGQKRMTAEDFARKHPEGKYLLRLANHITACVNGKIYDSWNCGNSAVYTSYKIQ